MTLRGLAAAAGVALAFLAVTAVAGVSPPSPPYDFKRVVGEVPLNVTVLVEFGEKQGFTRAALSPDGRLLAAGTDNGEILIVDLEAGDAIARYDVFKYIGGPVRGLGFAGERLVAAASYDGVVVVDVEAGEVHPLIQVGLQPARVWSVAATPEGLIAVPFNNGSVVIYRLAEGPSLSPVAIVATGWTGFGAVCFFPDGRVAAAYYTIGKPANVTVADASTGKVLLAATLPLDGHVAISCPRRDILAVYGLGEAIVYSIEGNRLRELWRLDDSVPASSPGGVKGTITAILGTSLYIYHDYTGTPLGRVWLDQYIQAATPLPGRGYLILTPTRVIAAELGDYSILIAKSSLEDTVFLRIVQGGEEAAASIVDPGWVVGYRVPPGESSVRLGASVVQSELARLLGYEDEYREGRVVITTPAMDYFSGYPEVLSVTLEPYTAVELKIDVDLVRGMFGYVLLEGDPGQEASVWSQGTGRRVTIPETGSVLVVVPPGEVRVVRGGETVYEGVVGRGGTVTVKLEAAGQATGTAKAATTTPGATPKATATQQATATTGGAPQAAGATTTSPGGGGGGSAALLAGVGIAVVALIAFLLTRR